VPRKKRAFHPAVLARRALFLVAGALLTGFLAVFLNAVLALYIPRHFAMSMAVGVAVAATLWLLRLAKHPPLLLKNVPPLAAGLCAGLGVHIARLWLR
jgi:membrane-associated protease RseP (regulator of RpoE activity)